MNVILSPDYDGLCSYMIYKIHTDSNIFGIYDCLTLKTTEKFSAVNKNDVLGLDLDFELCNSLGHHFLSSEFLNPQNNYDNPNVKLNIDVFTQKCPFSTALLLFVKDKNKRCLLKWYMKNNDLEKIACILYADNVLSFFRHPSYSSNVLRWLKYYDMEILYDFVQTNYEELNQKCEEIQKKIYNLDIIDIGSSKQGKYVQRIKEEKISELINFVANILNFDVNENFEMSNLKHNANFKFKSLTVEQAENNKSKILEKYDIISHAVLSKKKINFTLVEK